MQGNVFAFRTGMILSENRFPLFGIMPKLNAMTESPQAAEFPVYFVDGEPGFYWSLETRGLMLDAKGVEFTSDRETRKVLFSEIRSIRLHTNFVSTDDPPTGVCQIGFGQYRALTVLSGNARGLYDEEQRRHYGDFVRAFHCRIPQADREHIDFQGGLREGRTLVSVAMIAGAILFGVLPVGLLFVAPSFQVLVGVLTGWGLCYAGWRAWDKNRPRSYSPDRIPDDLLP
jgi:hypothetical protein